MLPEKLYILRKKRSLSQEQLAEQLCVSRQAISKWESGHAIPESDKLLAISNYFNVSLDYLMKEEPGTPPAESQEITPLPIRNPAAWIPGSILCVGGVICLIIWGLLSLIYPSVSNQISESSMIHMDGNGIFLILCTAAIVVGAVLLLKNTKNMS